MPSKAARWRVSQSRQKIKNKTKLAVVTLLLIILVILVGQLIRAIISLTQPLDGGSMQRVSRWSGKTNLTVVLKNSQVSLLEFDPNVKRLILLEIPGETYINVPGGFGSWQARSIDGLVQNGKSELLERALSDFFGLPLDGYIEFKGSLYDKKPKDLIGELTKNPWIGLSIKENLKSNLTPFELTRLIWGINGIRFDKVSDFKLENLGLLDTTALSDGSKVLTSNPGKLDSFSANYLSDSKIKEEQLTIAVYNGTETPGLAQKAARLITNMGGNVIISSNIDLVEHSYVVGQDSYTKKRLMQIFAPSGIVGGTTNFRAQVNVVLGKDYSP